MAFSGDQPPPHIAIIPSAGMGHLTPSCRLATTLATQGCHVSFVVIHPMVSNAESNSMTTFLSSFPSIHPIHVNVAPLTGSGDPFFLQFEAIRQSPHLILPLLNSSSPPITSFIVDIALASTFLPAITPTGISTYIFFTSSASMLAFFSYFPIHKVNKTAAATVGDVEVPGVSLVPMASVPMALHDPEELFTIQVLENARALVQANGVLINTFEALEPKALMALNDGVVVPGFPPVIAVGLLKQLSLKEKMGFPWLDEQPERSVLYVSFGSRTAMSVEYMRELGVGLVKSGAKFLWVIKMKKVDKEEEQVDLEQVLGEEMVERIKERGSMVVHGWVEQEEILKHGAVGGFLSHCGWNSVMEAALHGVPVLAWPRHGDQRVNAELVRRSGLGIWMEEWSWGGEGKVVKGEEIAERVKELMESPAVRSSVARMAAEAVKAVGEGRSSEKNLVEFIAKLKG
ncbi:UDP-glucose:2-hydroxyflavanone C-glucosyltransferase-like [Dioscorea cayenensis subsp. rotundata]|uniref:Glycosyltransferase n=1 Tax=Dioscorea cayennensis subsp. rotundata TaxID=55577 RepID=A0AB40BTS6_DIOCR|nr:UDP-glucose:2-hydroxyflavanone C-glucosyltransferase-like [Dioscorea cayenensis subsp. rotundata]